MIQRVIIFGMILIWAMTVSREVFAIESPQASVQALLGTIQKIQSGDSVPPDQEKVNVRLSARALTFFDMGALSRKTLGKYWKLRSDQEKKSFIALLSKLFEKVAFPNSARFFADLEIQYRKGEVEGDRAKVPIMVAHEKEGEVGIDFIMHRAQDGWRVIDVILDDVSMRNNLRSQFYKVIASNDYSELFRRMNKKLLDDK